MGGSLKPDARKGFRRLSVLLAVVGLVGAVTSLFGIVDRGIDFFGVSALIGSLVFCGANLSFAFLKRAEAWVSRAQACAVLVLGVVAALVTSPDDYAGMVIVGVATTLLAKNGLIRTPIQLLFVMFAAVSLDFIVALLLQDAQPRVALAVAAASFGAFGLVYYAFYGELQQALRSVRLMRMDATVREQIVHSLKHDLDAAETAHEQMRGEVSTYAEKVHLLSRRIQELESVRTPLDVTLFDVSPREQEVLRELVRTKGRNRDIADRLGITERTVKAHIYNICNKIGVDTRIELMELFRYNWPDADS